MPSFNVVNYSLRPNKSIQRSLIFEGYKTLQEQLALDDILYIGFGSIWFSDFISAHKNLHIDRMISIESDDIGFRRAEFNKPFRCVDVKNDISTNVLREISENKSLRSVPWFVWLDYDGVLDESVVEDLRLVIENAPPNSALITTFNADNRNMKNYGKPKDRPERLKNLLGDVVPDDLSKEKCDGTQFAETLADLTSNFLKSSALQISRPGGFEAAFRVHYRDGADMVTVGGFLPNIGTKSTVRQIIESPQWPCLPKIAVTTPPLTLKESAILQAQLPRTKRLTRAAIRRLGFDLEEEQILAYEMYYKYYPAYAQITT